MTREGGCLCGAVRYRVKNDPMRGGVCHCRSCQRRTGSAFGIGAHFKEADVEVRGELSTYEFRSPAQTPLGSFTAPIQSPWT